LTGLQSIGDKDVLTSFDNNRSSSTSITALLPSNEPSFINLVSKNWFATEQQSNTFVFNDLDSTVKSLIRKLDTITSSSQSSDYANDMDRFNVVQAPTNAKKTANFGGMPNVTVEAVGVLLSMGTLWFVAGKSTLIASVVATLPSWQRMDPLYVVAQSDYEDPEKVHEKLDVVDHIFDAEAAQHSSSPGNLPLS